MGLFNCLAQLLANRDTSVLSHEVSKPSTVNPETGLSKEGEIGILDVAGNPFGIDLLRHDDPACNCHYRWGTSTSDDTISRHDHNPLPDMGSDHVLGAPDRVSLLDRWIARWEVSQLAFLPIAFSLVSLWVCLITVRIVGTIAGTRLVLTSRILCGVWLVLAGFELGRSIWTVRHRYASPRWLQGISVAVGGEVVVHALAVLIERHRHNPDYVVTRSDMTHAVQAERGRRRDLDRRAEGFRLVEALPSDPKASAILERCRRARKRRADRRTGQPA